LIKQQMEQEGTNENPGGGDYFRGEYTGFIQTERSCDKKLKDCYLCFRREKKRAKWPKEEKGL